MKGWPAALLPFIELGVDEGLDGVEGAGLVLLVALADLDVALEAGRHVDELRRRARMKSQLVLDLEGTLRQDEAPTTLRSADSRSEATRMAFEPFSLMMCASVVTSFASCCI